MYFRSLSKTKTKENKSFKERAIDAIKQSHYKTAMWALLESRVGKRDLLSVLSKCIRREVQSMLKNQSSPLATPTKARIKQEDLKKFKMTHILETLKTDYQFIDVVLDTLLQPKRSSKTSVI